MPNDDYIKRSDAKRALTALSADLDAETVQRCIEAMNSPKAADVEPKREIVSWKVAGAFDDFYQCTKCGNMWPIFSTVEWAYCPVCGCRKFSESLKSWRNNPWCNAVDKALEQPLKGEEDGAN